MMKLSSLMMIVDVVQIQMMDAEMFAQTKKEFYEDAGKPVPDRHTN